MDMFPIHVLFDVGRGRAVTERKRLRHFVFMRRIRYCFFPLALGLASLSAVALVPVAFAEEKQATVEPLSIKTASGTHVFSVEVMRTDAERERGLMFRRYLPLDRGMLFNFEVEQPVMMWMKNTYLPLDMIFITRTGKVVNIAAETEPLSETVIPSAGPIYAVLEVNAGTAASIGLKVGDTVHNEIFGN
jgi:uncharacterized membrane protein (UPF0127 family)